ncbi:MAG: hypothetical protein ACO1SV_25885 [Fimbriimonas sp.]
MAETKTRHAGEERLTPAEVATLQARFAEAGKDSVTVRSLSETSGLDEAAVRDQLQRIRAEGAVAPRTWSAAPTRPRWPFFAVGAAGLAIVAGIAFFRQPEPAAPVTLPNRPTSTQTVVNEPRPATFQYGSGMASTPPGVRVSISFNGRQHIGQDDGVRSFPQPYERQRDQIMNAIDALTQLAKDEEARNPTTAPNGKFKDDFGNVVELEPGYIHVAIQGWAMMVAEKVRYPFNAAERAQLLKAVEKVLAVSRHAQAEGLKPSQEGVVSPPPGFRMAFAGRRLDERSGPSLYFAPVGVASVQRRMEEALRNAVSRDAKPSLDSPPVDAPGAVGIPAPPRYLGEIEGPAGIIRFDIPSAPDAARDGAIRELAERAARQMVPVNERAAKPPVKDGSPPPPPLKRVSSVFRG